MKEELLKLAERVEALSGPDRLTDANIHWQIRRDDFEPDEDHTDQTYCYARGGWTLNRADHHFLDSIPVPRYSSSLDAAMTLVPKTMSLVDLTLSWEPPEPEVFPACSITWYPAAVIHNGKDWHALTASGATPALALTAAAIRALAKEK